jgi:CheY-like chemotaxis protein
VPVVVLGATQETYAPGSSIHPAMQAGADAFLARPVMPAELTEQLDALFDSAASSSRPLRITGRFSAPPKVVPTTGRITGSLSPVQPPAAPAVARLTPPGIDRAALSDDPPPPQPTLPAQARLSSPAEAYAVRIPSEVAEVGEEVRRSIEGALLSEGVEPAEFELPPVTDDALDDLVPPELLEPLDGPMDSMDHDLPYSMAHGASASPTQTGVPGASRRGVGGRGAVTGNNVMPLTLDGDLRLAGSLGRYGVAMLLSAAWRGRSTGVIALHSHDTEWTLTLNAGHLLAVRGSRPEHLIGPILARLGYIPREAARFAHVPLDAGLRGAALLAAQGYIAPDGIAPILARAAQEMIFDLLCLDTVEWELRAVEHSVGVPLPTRALDALLVLGARARLEPAQAFLAMGGDDTTVSLRADPSTLVTLPLTAQERDAAVAAKGTSLAAVVRSHGESVLPALLALSWLQLLRLEGIPHELGAAKGLPGPERPRVRALVEAAERRDLLALLGVSPWATQRAAQLALESRRAEVDVIRARHGATQVLKPVYAALEEATAVIENPAAWDRYASVLRVSPRDEG